MKNSSRNWLPRHPDDNDGTMSDMAYALMRGYELSGIARWRHWWLSRGKRNAVFIWIPKNAGTSFFNRFAGGGAPKCKSLRRLNYRFPQRGLVTFGHMDYARLVDEGWVREEFDRSAFKFCFSRNPYARAVSLFRYLTNPKTQTTFLEFCRHLRESSIEPIGLYNSRGNSLCNPQVRWTERVSLDFVGRVESIDRDVEDLFSRLQLSHRPLDRLNQTSSSDYRAVYCAESARIVQQLYDEDFETFGYSRRLEDQT